MDDPKNPGWFEPDFPGREGDYPVKREYRRIIFRKIMGVYTYLEGTTLTEVEVLNISPKGCAFRMPKDAPVLAEGDEVAFRFYFTLNTYLPAHLEIRNTRHQYDEGLEYRVYGAAFDQSLDAYPCLKNFIENIYIYAEHCEQDNRGSIFGT